MAWEAPRWVRVRLFVAAGTLGLLFLLLGGRAFVLQVQKGDIFKAAAESQYLRDVELPAKRGRIFDRHGHELAASAEVDSVHADPSRMSHVPEVARALADALKLDRHDLEKKLRSSRYFVWIKRRITAEEARAVRELELPNVYLDKEPRRYYPNRALGGPLLGWAGLDAVGQEGIELEYDRYLRGNRAAVPGLRDALGREVLAAGVGDAGEQTGGDVHTTLDRYVQFRVEQALERAVHERHARAGVAVALDPRSGEILAMASVPTLNPNEPDGAHESGARNRAVTDAFEPGSTIKTFAIAAAIEAGLVRPGDHWFCENGRWQLGPATLHDAELIGDATTTQVLARSSNICTAKIAARAGRERLHDVLTRFGFGKPTGVDLPGERSGQLRAAARMGLVETATISFGQGMTSTPLQVAAAYAALANDGVWRRPHVLRRVVDAAGRTTFEPAVEARRVISPQVAATMREMLVAVTRKGGTGERVSVPGYTFAGKTGTAQKVDPLTRHYSTDKWASSFVGFAPVEDPRLVLFVMIDEPQGLHYGSLVAGPVFQEVMVDVLRWLDVPASPSAAIAGAPTPRAAALVRPESPSAGALELVREKDADDADDGVGAEVAAADEPTGTAEVPDFTGMSLGEALDCARRAGLRVEVVGSGIATAQSPGPGQTRRADGACRVVFTPPG